MLSPRISNPLTLRVDPAFLRLDDSIAEIYVLAESVHRDDGNLETNAERYATFYEHAERIIVRLLKFRGIEVDAQRTSPFQHSYHESVLQTLADEGNVFHHILGSGNVRDSLRHAKTFRNKERSSALSAYELRSCEGPRITSRTKVIARALEDTSDFARSTVINGYTDSTLSQLLETHAVEKATPGAERISRNWLTLQGRGPRNPSSAVKEAQFRLELGNNGNNIHERVRSALLEAFYSHLSILQQTLDDVSSMFERAPQHGQAQEELLNRFVSSRLDKRRQKAKGDLDTLMGDLSARAVDSIRARITRVVELETLNRRLRVRGGQTETRLRIMTVDAKKELEQLTKLRKENEDLRLKLEQATSNHNNAVNPSKAISDENAVLQSQLEAERKSHEACQTHTAALVAEKKLLIDSCSGIAYTKLEGEFASHGLTMRRAVGFLNAKYRTLQEETQGLRTELAAERSSREAAEANARWYENEVDSIRTGMESILRRPLRPERT